MARVLPVQASAQRSWQNAYVDVEYKPNPDSKFISTSMVSKHAAHTLIGAGIGLATWPAKSAAYWAWDKFQHWKYRHGIHDPITEVWAARAAKIEEANQNKPIDTHIGPPPQPTVPAPPHRPEIHHTEMTRPPPSKFDSQKYKHDLWVWEQWAASAPINPMAWFAGPRPDPYDPKYWTVQPSDPESYEVPHGGEFEPRPGQ